MADGRAIGVIQYTPVVASTSGQTAVLAAPSNSAQKYRILAMSMMSSGSVNYKWQSGNTDLTGLAYCVANSLKINDYCPVGWFDTNAGDPLNINLSGNTAIGGEIVYTTLIL